MMKPINAGFAPLLLGLTLFTAGISSQERNRDDYLQKYQYGTQLYSAEHWLEAAIEFRRAQEISQNADDWSEAIYWVILSELAYSDYGSAVMDMNELDRRMPNSDHTRDMVYHRARVYYNQAYFDDALLLFRRYIASVSHLDDSLTSDRTAAAFFWMGECLYSMGQYDEAQKFYSWVIDKYPKSPKYDACLYRFDMIKQKKIEVELLALLQWSHEESLRTSENYQRTVRTYETTLNELEKRIRELGGYPGPILQSGNDSGDDDQSKLLDRARFLLSETERLLKQRYNDSGGSW
jgi:tetratricopeptide (TPR) repeat protein